MRGFTHIRVRVVISREDAQKIGYCINDGAYYAVKNWKGYYFA